MDKYLSFGIFTVRKRSLGQGNVFTSVCYSVRGGSLHPEGALHPGGVGQTPHKILQDTVNERAVHILLECILVM